MCDQLILVALFCLSMSYEGVTNRNGLRCPPFSDNYRTKTAKNEAPAPLPGPPLFTGHNELL